jgi:molybdopterin-guanine dinucleotide biosynthesis protein A
MTFTAVLFVGGLSLRMGQDKATLDFNGEPLWARQIRLLRELQPDALVISARERPAWSPSEIKVVLDAPPSCGPLSGLVATLQRMQTTHLLALAIDLPQMHVEHLLKLQTLAKPNLGCVPSNEDFFEPLAAIYPVAAKEIAADALTKGKLSLQNFVQQLVREGLVETYSLSDLEKSFYRNMNTPADLRKAAD